LAQTEQPPSQPCIQLDRNECAISVRFTFHLVHGRTDVVTSAKYETKHQTSTLSTTSGMGLLRHLLPVLLIYQVIAQSCLNYGNVNGTSCECPPGVGGSTCNDPACGGNLFQGSSRPTIQATSGSLYGNLTTCQCESGWGGVGCNGTSALIICSIVVRNKSLVFT